MSMVAKAIDNEWDDFERQVVPQGANEIQRAAMRQAFYAGAIAALNLLGERATALHEETATAAGAWAVSQPRIFSEKCNTQGL